MIFSKIAVCPVCHKRTWLRITDGGYLEEYPVRFHCKNCRTLIRGVYSTTASKTPTKLTLINAGYDQSPEYEQCCSSDYVVEISGELPCKKVAICNGTELGNSALFRTEPHIDLVGRIKQLKEFNVSYPDWKEKKHIAFQLLSDGSIEYIPTALGNKLGTYSYECDNKLKSLHCLQHVVLSYTEHIFCNEEQHRCIQRMVMHLAPIDRDKLDLFLDRLGGTDFLLSAYRKAIDVFTSFMPIYPNLLPAETLMQYNSEDTEDLGIATCSFTDIKTFYQDAYESLLPLIIIPLCLDNILERGDYKSFNPCVFKNVKKLCDPNADDYEWFDSLDNGMKLKRSKTQEFMQSAIALPGDRDLRNGIGHNNIEYDGLTQMITAYEFKKPYKPHTYSLIEMAIDCLKIAKSAVMLSETILFLLRHAYEKDGVKSLISIEFYDIANADAYDLCPCGSGKKYKFCCKKDVEGLKNPRRR